MKDNLSSSGLRLKCADDLITGIKLVNRLLQMRLPIPAPLLWKRDLLAEQKFEDPDLLFAHLLGALFDKNIGGEDDWYPLLKIFETFFYKTQSISVGFPDTLNAAGLSDPELIDEISNTMEVSKLTLQDFFSGNGYVFVKINHAHWEYLTNEAFKTTGNEYFRNFSGFPFFKEGRCDELLIHCLQLIYQQFISSGLPAGCFCSDDFSLGISFNNGDGYLSDDLSLPILPIMRGAMVGSYGFFKGLFPATCYRFIDGSFPKMLIWNYELDHFFQILEQRSDIIVFIVPAHLRRILLRNWSGAVKTIVIPSSRVHEFWPPVLSVVLAQLNAVLEKYKRVGILVQAGLMSVPFGIAVHQLRQFYPKSDIRYMDMGQALDVAGFPYDMERPWINQPEAQEVLTQTGEFPVFLEDFDSEEET